MSFTRNELIEQYHKSQFDSNIPADRFILSAGGALVMYRIRDVTDDLDIDTDEEHYQKLVDAGYPVIDDGFPRVRLNEHTDVHVIPTPWVETMPVDGVWCYTLEDLVTQYVRLAAHPARNPEKVVREIGRASCRERVL